MKKQQDGVRMCVYAQQMLILHPILALYIWCQDQICSSEFKACMECTKLKSPIPMHACGRHVWVYRAGEGRQHNSLAVSVDVRHRA